MLEIFELLLDRLLELEKANARESERFLRERDLLIEQIGDVARERDALKSEIARLRTPLGVPAQPSNDEIPF